MKLEQLHENERVNEVVKLSETQLVLLWAPQIEHYYIINDINKVSILQLAKIAQLTFTPEQLKFLGSRVEYNYYIISQPFSERDAEQYWYSGVVTVTNWADFSSKVKRFIIPLMSYEDDFQS